MNNPGFILLGLAAPHLSGYRSIGPRTIPRDRYDYSSSISESWKRQTLLNRVKLRYLDPLMFVNAGHIVAGYANRHRPGAGSYASCWGFRPRRPNSD